MIKLTARTSEAMEWGLTLHQRLANSSREDTLTDESERAEFLNKKTVAERERLLSNISQTAHNECSY
jgi:hypothetical protein